MNFKICFVIVFARVFLSSATVLRNFPLDTIEFFNLKMLNNSLHIGWKYFCNADVDEGVMSLYPESSPSSVEILVLDEENHTVSISVERLTDLSEFGFESCKRTLLIVNGISDPESTDVRDNLLYLQRKLSCKFNIIIVDFGANLFQIYNSVKRYVQTNAFLVSKILEELKKGGVQMDNLILVGHSVGANIAALGAEMFKDRLKFKKLPILIALDPARMCSKDQIYVNPTVCKKVVVVHGDTCALGVAENVGTIDIYPNAEEDSYQPGCSNSLCSHMYPLMLFVRALTGEMEVYAVKCQDWSAFKRGKCNFKDLLKIGLDYNPKLTGKYYSLTGKILPFSTDVQSNQKEILGDVTQPTTTAINQ